MHTDIFKNLMAVKQRIDGQRAELEKELIKLEDEKEKIETGHFEKPNAFSLEDVLGSKKTSSIEEISRKISSIKAALALPYYADSEYRSLSIAYMEAVTEAEAAEFKQNEKAVEAAENIIAEAQEQLAKLRDQRGDIREAAINKMNRVGLESFSHYAVYCSPDHLLMKYKELCSKYK